MNNESLIRSLKVILAVCLVCSLMVSTAAILLKPKQNENQRQNRIGNILAVAGLLEANDDSEEIYRQRIEAVLIELKSGQEAAEADIGPGFSVEDFDIASFAMDPVLGEIVPSQNDVADIVRRPRFMAVYIAKTEGGPDKLILPIFGKGLWSTIYGLIALDRDLRTIAGITFYQHGETPGLGGEIENSAWQAQWRGKRPFDRQDRVVIKVLRGEVDAGSAAAQYQVDGLSGATITSRGVQKMLHYWLGEHGYGPLLKRLRREWSTPSLAQQSG